MPRRAAAVERDIPLFLVPHLIRKGICRFGEEVERIIVRKNGSHVYNISIRSRAIKRELRQRVKRAGTQNPPQSSPGGVAA